jgi:hypothetical protein
MHHGSKEVSAEKLSCHVVLAKSLEKYFSADGIRSAWYVYISILYCQSLHTHTSITMPCILILSILMMHTTQSCTLPMHCACPQDQLFLASEKKIMAAH